VKRQPLLNHNEVSTYRSHEEIRSLQSLYYCGKMAV
jgi:hypothetical protein